MTIPEEFEIEIKRLVFGGEGLGYLDNRPVFVYGVLPNEQVLVRPIKFNKKFIKAAPVKILKPSPKRVSPQDEHFLTCGPWQIMSYQDQLVSKRSVTESMWSSLVGEPQQFEIVSSPLEWHYRNKLEFSFIRDSHGRLTLSFHERYRYGSFLSLESCALGHQRINAVAQKIVNILNDYNVKVEELKNLLVRYSYLEDRCVAVLYVNDPEFKTFSVKIPGLAGWMIVYSDPKSPTTITTKILIHEGNDFLKEKIGDVILKYNYDGFFQVNPPAFEKIIDRIKTDRGDQLLDLYSGVGTIGLALVKNFKKVYSVEFDSRASNLARENVLSNSIDNVEVINGAAEKVDLGSLLSNVDTLIVDPPRNGLHPRVVNKILENPPQTIIYVSCNPSTQARDWNQLKTRYQIVDTKLFDLYPQTPHVESVIIAKTQH